MFQLNFPSLGIVIAAWVGNMRKKCQGAMSAEIIWKENEEAKASLSASSSSGWRISRDWRQITCHLRRFRPIMSCHFAGRPAISQHNNPWRRRSHAKELAENSSHQPRLHVRARACINYHLSTAAACVLRFVGAKIAAGLAQLHLDK